MPHKKQGNITVDAARELPVPKDAHAALERSDHIDAGMPKDHTAEHQPYHEPTMDGHPALKHLKQAEHVHHVFGHPTGKKY